MPDFDAKEDSPRLSGAGQDDSRDLPEPPARISPRGRELASRDCSEQTPRVAQLISARLGSRARHAARRSCSTREHVIVLAAPARRRRRLWTACHGHRFGSPS
jgi:hypothetical protein